MPPVAGAMRAVNPASVNAEVDGNRTPPSERL
jgi:hypothetical protein